MARTGFVSYLSIFGNRRIGAMILMGFSSGLPLALTGGTLQAWLAVSGVDVRAIGLFSLVGLPYTLKFLWAPFMDRFTPPWLGRRRGWIVTVQVMLMALTVLLGSGSPEASAVSVAVIALAVAFLSASQDIVIDAYRTDVLHDLERGIGSAVFVTGYRIAMLVSGALALILADRIGWRYTYWTMAGVFSVCIAATLWSPDPEVHEEPPKSMEEAIWGPLRHYFGRPSATAFLLLIVLYKLGDAYAGTLTTAFLIRGAGFSPTDVGAVNKGFGLLAVILGATAGGTLMVKLGLFRSLMLFGLLQAASNLSFSLLAAIGKNYPVMIFAVGFENFTGGMGTSAFVSLVMALCDRRYSATQFALLSSLSAVGRVLVSPTSGFVVAQTGWAVFFVITTLTALPGLALLWMLRRKIDETCQLDAGV